MPKFSIDQMPEVFVSDTNISKAVSDAVARGKLRKIGSRLYTRNLDEAPEKLVLRNWYYLIKEYFPDAIITDRTAIENQPAEDGSVCLISTKKREVELPGLVFRPRKGPGPLESDRLFVGGARLASTARAYLENMRSSRARGGRLARTLSSEELEERLDTLLRRQGQEALNNLRDEARSIAPKLGLENEFEKFNDLIGTLIGTRDAEVSSDVAKARVAGQPFDPDRIRLFEALFAALRETVPHTRPSLPSAGKANANLSFFESYFSNFIEGTEFTIDEAEEIIFGGVIPQERPDDAHDVLGTFRLVSDRVEMERVPSNFQDFIEILRHRHATIMEARPDKNPGTFKSKVNRAGATVFVMPDLVEGTLQRGFEFFDGLADPFQRATFMMVLVNEVHPFTDGNGRTARVMMNAELVARDEVRIIIPTAYRIDYLDALRALSLNTEPVPVIRMLDYAQRYTQAIDWSDFRQAQNLLQETGAFGEGEDAHIRIP